MGVRELAAHLAGELTLAEAVALARQETRRYAKRQLTWLRRKMISWRPISTQQMKRIEAIGLSFSED